MLLLTHKEPAQSLQASFEIGRMFATAGKEEEAARRAYGTMSSGRRKHCHSAC